jgi:hypothetical protein
LIRGRRGKEREIERENSGISKPKIRREESNHQAKLTPEAISTT